MAELISVLGIVSSIGQIIDGTTKLIGWIGETKNASKDARDFLQDAIEIQSLVSRLKFRLEDRDTPEAWLKGVLQLEPLINHLNELLFELVRKVQPAKGVAKLSRHVLWTLKKQDIKDILDRIERLKALIGLALNDKLWDLASAIKADTAIIGDVHDKVQRVDSGVKELQSQARHQRQQNIVEFIAPHDFAAKHGSILAQRQPGTGQWFLDAPEYQGWIKSEPRKGNTLWCPGIPGAGKTTMVSIVVDELQQRFRGDTEAAIGFLYYDYREREIQTHQNMLASLWRHFVQNRLLDRAECEAFEKNYVKKNQRPQAADLIKLLYSEVQHYSKVYIVLDALDESWMNHGTKLLAGLRTLQPLVRILVTSRFVIEEESALYDTAEQLRIRASKADLQEYIDKRIESEAKLSSSVRRDPSLGQAIADTVAEKAQGMFLLARFHMDSLLQEHTPKRLRKALAALPQGENSLRETYDEAMKRVESQGPKDQQLAKRVLAFICYTKKPLSKEELQHALSVEDGDEDPLDGESLIPEGLLTSLCAGLVTVDEAIGTIRFVHYTTQEYFEVVREDRFPDAQLDMARTCLTYLRLESFDVEVRDGTEGVEDLTSQYPFLGYASLFWGHHVRDAEKSDDEQLSKDVMDFFDHKRNFNSATRVLLLHPSGEFLGHLAWYHPKGKAHFHLLNVAAYFGLDAIVSKMLGELNVDDVGKSGYVDSNDGFLGNALHWASIGDHEHVLKRLLNLPGTRDIINVLGPEGETSPLHQAIIHRRAIPIKLLLEHGADIYQRRGDYAANSCLELALHTCPLEIIKLLFGADKERKLLKMNQFMNTSPFHTAAGLNYSEALQLMLDLGDEVYQDNIFRYQDIIDNHTRCPLHVSAEYGATDTTRVLLRHRLSNRLMAVRDRNGANPFHLAITQGGVAVTKTFLDEKGILLLNERIGSDGGLHIAASRGEPDVVGLLLDHAPISYYVNEDKSVLHSAARSGSAATVKVVLDKAGNWMVEHPDSHRRTPLHDAAMQGHIEVVQVLLSNEANPNALDDTGKTPLHFAAMGSFDKLVKLLVNAGSRLELKDLEENTALLLAMKQRAITSVHALLKLGAKMPELDEDLQAWASAQPWWNEDGRFSSHLADYYPETSKDVFQAADDLQEISKLPRGIVHVILDKAEYWLRSDAQRAEQHLVNDYHGDLVYLQSQPITGKVQRIIFTITSHDQGWSDHAHDHGTYNGSWTWFSAWKLSGPNKTQGPEILRNMHARREPNTLHVCWPWRDGYHWHSAEGPESEALQNEWIRKLKEGDRVLIVAKAKYPGWTNFVIRAEISIFTSVI